MGFGLGLGYAQTDKPDFAQIAFDFYQTEIQLKYPVKKRINVWKELRTATSDPFWHPRCLEGYKLNGIDSLNEKISDRTNLDLSNLDKSKFKIKPNGKGNTPIVFINKPFTIKGLNIFVNITELKKDRVNIYHVEIDKNGRILDWCKGGYIY